MRTRRTSFLLAGALCATAMFACGGSTDTVGEPGPTPNPTPVGTGNPGVPGPDLEEVAKEPANVGYVNVHTPEYAENSSGESTFSVESAAWFGKPVPPGEGISDCQLIENKFDESAPEEADPASENAGTIDIELTTGTEKSTLDLPFDKREKRYLPNATEVSGPPSGMIRVRAQGGVVPAFTVDLVPQTPVKIVSPTRETKVGARDLSVSWTADPTAEFVVVWVMALEKEIQCSVKSGNVLTIPAALMASVLDDERTSGISLWVYAGKSTKVDVGDYRVRVQHSSSTFTSLWKE